MAHETGNRNENRSRTRGDDDNYFSANYGIIDIARASAVMPLSMSQIRSLAQRAEGLESRLRELPVGYLEKLAMVYNFS